MPADKQGMKTVSHAAGMSGIIIMEAIKEYKILCRWIHKATSEWLAVILFCFLGQWIIHVGASHSGTLLNGYL